MVSFTLKDTLPLGKEPTIPIEEESRWAPELVWMLLKRGKSLPPSGIKSCFLSVSSPT
jgi:hypothetical protein